MVFFRNKLYNFLIVEIITRIYRQNTFLFSIDPGELNSFPSGSNYSTASLAHGDIIQKEYCTVKVVSATAHGQFQDWVC